MVVFLPMCRAVRLDRILALVAISLPLAACTPAGGPSSSSSPSMRCMNEPGRGSSTEDRPLFFVFCAQSP
jgi:hypothetical protein